MTRMRRRRKISQKRVEDGDKPLLLKDGKYNNIFRRDRNEGESYLWYSILKMKIKQTNKYTYRIINDDVVKNLHHLTNYNI
jgi:hypothetical protein